MTDQAVKEQRHREYMRDHLQQTWPRDNPYWDRCALANDRAGARCEWWGAASDLGVCSGVDVSMEAKAWLAEHPNQTLGDYRHLDHTATQIRVEDNEKKKQTMMRYYPEAVAFEVWRKTRTTS